MTNQTPSNDPSPSEEIDLGKLFQVFRKVMDRIFTLILRIFLFFKRNAFKLLALVVIGVAIGLLLKSFIDKKLKTEVIVKPNFESKDYVYDVVNEIQANVAAKDTLFFRSLGMDINAMRDFEIRIEPIEDPERDQEKVKENNQYLEMLQYYKDNDFVIDVVRSEILKKSGLTHRITFLHKNPKEGEEFARKLMIYINANPYFGELKTVNAENVKSRILENRALVKQIDDLVANYNKQLSEGTNREASMGMVFLDKEKSLDISALLTLKNMLISQIEQKHIEAVQEKEAVSIINFGKTQVVEKQFLNKSILFIPLILVAGFFAWSLLSYLNRKTKDL